MAEDDMVGDNPIRPTRITESVSKMDIRKNSEGVIDMIKGVPLSIVPNSTIGEMTQAIREYTKNKVTGARMSISAASAIAADILSLRHANKATPPSPEPEEGEGKGRADTNAA